MKYFFLFLIGIYQIFLSPLLRSLLGAKGFCRYSPTCSAYAKDVMQKEGICSLPKIGKRLLSCQPFSKVSYGTI